MAANHLLKLSNTHRPSTTKMHYRELGNNVLDKIIYRGEGNSSIVIALKNQAKVIRLLKKDGKIMKFSKDHHATEHPMRSIKFIHLIIKPLTDPFLSEATELIHLKSDFINMISKNVEAFRPLHRLDKTLLLDDQYALVMDDLCTLPNHITQQIKFDDLIGPTISVEIKPKQGFLPIHRLAMKSSINEQQTKKPRNCCIYGSNQNLKLARGRISHASDYCPINLFSGCPIRMKSALEELIHNPQNNLRVFKDLIFAYGESKHKLKLSNILEDFFICNNNVDKHNNVVHSEALINYEVYLIELLIQCLLNDHCDNNNSDNNTTIVDNENSFSNGSENCLKHEPKTKCRSCDIYPSEFHKKNSIHRLPQSCVLFSVLRAQKLDTIGAHEALYMLEWLLEDSKTDKTIDILEELSKPQMPTGFGSLHQLATETKQQYYFRKVWEFLVSLTAKDCSIIITLRQVRPSHYESIISGNVSLKKHILCNKTTGNYYMFNVGIADLDQKMPLKIPRICENLNIILQNEKSDIFKLDSLSNTSQRKSIQKVSA